MSKAPPKVIWEALGNAGCPDWLRAILILPLTAALYIAAAFAGFAFFYALLRMMSAVIF